MLCQKCGQEMPDNTKFCANCGAATAENPVQQNTSASQENQNSSGPRVSFNGLQPNQNNSAVQTNSNEMQPNQNSSGPRVSFNGLQPNQNNAGVQTNSNETQPNQNSSGARVSFNGLQPNQNNPAAQPNQNGVQLNKNNPGTQVNPNGVQPNSNNPGAQINPNGVQPNNNNPGAQVNPNGVQPNQNTPGSQANGTMPSPKAKKKPKTLIIVLICVICFVVMLIVGASVAGWFIYNRLNGADDVVSYVDSKDSGSKSKNSDFDEIQSLLSSCDYVEAAELLGDMNIDESHDDYELYKNLMTAASMAPEIDSINSDACPVIAVKLDHQSLDDYEFTTDNFSVLEDGTEIKDYEVITDSDGSTIVSYMTSAVEPGKDIAVDITVNFGTVSIPLTQKFTIPSFAPANVEFVSADVSEYPLVKLYLRVTDSGTNAAVENLLENSFVIQERLEGGDYLAREIKEAFSLEGNDGLNTALVADKSDSIEDGDMENIKSVMTAFVNKMDYDGGDQVMVIAFDSIVQTMCTFTDDPGLLAHGISNMSTDGMTACYDAIYNAVQNASLRGGARCVIAFTDGIDNSSIHTSQEVINFANTMQVPLYIIGVGSDVERNVLVNMAETTGGRYWDIYDLYDLESIFNEIYGEQMDLYVVQYESESGVDANAERDIIVNVNGGGHSGDLNTTFKPILSANNKHESGYEIFAADVSWEEANALCIEKGGHLATITDKDEEKAIIKMAEDKGLDYVWLGGYTSFDSYNNVFAHWITGEQFSYENWAKKEPSRTDMDGTPEWYLMLWNVESLGGWTWNDQRNDPAAEVNYMNGRIGYVCEYE